MFDRIGRYRADASACAAQNKRCRGRRRRVAEKIETAANEKQIKAMYGDASKKALDEWLAAHKVTVEKRQKANECAAEMAALFEGSFYFRTMLQPVKTIRTNSDGKFKLTVARDRDWVIAARSRRSIGDSTERYYWVVPIPKPDGDRAELQLSNDNLTTVDGGSLIFTLDS